MIHSVARKYFFKANIAEAYTRGDYGTSQRVPLTTFSIGGGRYTMASEPVIAKGGCSCPGAP